MERAIRGVAGRIVDMEAKERRMGVTRREFLTTSAVATAATTMAGAGCAPHAGEELPRRRRYRGQDPWERIRAEFHVDPAYVHMAGLLLASHPDPVRRAVERHRLRLDDNPALYVQGSRPELEEDTRRAAARYLGVQHRDVALTDSTTMGIGLVYAGIQVRPGQEMLTGTMDYYSTRRSLAYRAARGGPTVREYHFPSSHRNASAGEIVERIASQVRPETRVLAATWVHSSTGLKLPARAVADALARINAERAEEDRVLFCLDGVHGLGVENVELGELGCDVFMAGTHKWLFGPRGTGVLWGDPRVQGAVAATIPTFTRDGTWGGEMTPGGFKAFEHQWALARAFDWHREIGKEEIERRIHALAGQCREGLARMRHVTLHTPLDPTLASGIVCFDVDGMRPEAVVRRLRDRNVIASTTPYTPTYARLTPGLLNTPEEVETTLAMIHEMR
jgi:isopenicillin-N epimerase